MNGGGTKEAFADRIYRAAINSRASYNTMAATVSKLGMQAGDAFAGPEELIKFTENLNKIFVTSGLDSGGIQSVMYNLTQSMSTGKLLGNDYRILKMNAPEFVKMLKKAYADDSQEKLDKMVSSGKITADMLKKAILDNTDEIQKKFEEMPVTWENVFTKIKNITQRMLKPVLLIVNNLANSADKLITGVEKNWNKIYPVLMVGLGILITYWGMLLITKIKDMAVTIKTTALSAIATVQNYLEAKSVLAKTATINELTNAQYRLKLVMAEQAVASTPLLITLGKIAIVLLAIVAAAKLVSVAMEKITGQTYSVLGLITAGLGLVAGVVINVISTIINAIIWVLNLIGSLITGHFNKAYAVLLDFAIAFMEVINALVVGVAKLFGSTAEGFSDMIWEMKKERNMALQGNDYQGIDYVDFGSVADWTWKGYHLGEGISKGISGAFGLEDVMGSDGMGGSAIKTTSNDRLLKDEDIQLLLDVATRDYKLNYQQLTPEITVTFTGDINETADVDVVKERIISDLEEIVYSDLGTVSA